MMINKKTIMGFIGKKDYDLQATTNHKAKQFSIHFDNVINKNIL